MQPMSRRSLFIASAGIAALAWTNTRVAAADKLSLESPSRFIGKWSGEGSGEPGDSKVERSYEMTRGDNFILVRNASTYAPQEKNPKGEVHSDVGYVSLDKARQRFVLRQFHLNEAFVNQYVSTGFTGDELIFDSEAIENIPAGWRARETYRFTGNDAFEEIFELSEPGQTNYSVYSHNKLRRA